VSGSRLLVLDAVNVSSPGGMQLQLQLARSALQRRPPGSELLLLQADTEDAPAADPEVRLERFPPRRGWGAMARWFARELPGIARARGADAVYSLSGILSPALCREFATVNTINNMLPFTPEQIRYFPFWSPDRQRFYLLRFAYVWSSKRADALVVPSRFALTAMAPYAGNLAGKAFVAMNPVPERVRVRPEDPPAHPHGGRPFFFYLSVVFWYKNHLTLIEGYRRALAAEPDLPDLPAAALVPQVEGILPMLIRKVGDPAAVRRPCRLPVLLPRGGEPSGLSPEPGEDPEAGPGGVLLHVVRGGGDADQRAVGRKGGMRGALELPEVLDREALSSHGGDEGGGAAF